MSTPATRPPDPAATFAPSGGWLLVAAGGVAAGLSVAMRLLV